MRALRSVCAFLTFSCALLAQFDSGQISGFVRDATGAVIAGAAVSVTNEGNGEQHKTTTNNEGYYIFPQLFVGRYAVAVEASGFKKYVQTSIVVDSQAKVAIDVPMTVGALTEQVMVEASAAQVKTDSADVGTTIDNKQIAGMVTILARHGKVVDYRA